MRNGTFNCTLSTKKPVKALRYCNDSLTRGTEAKRPPLPRSSRLGIRNWSNSDWEEPLEVTGPTSSSKQEHSKCLRALSSPALNTSRTGRSLPWPCSSGLPPHSEDFFLSSPSLPPCGLCSSPLSSTGLLHMWAISRNEHTRMQTTRFWEAALDKIALRCAAV